ncbi:MAG: enoyl-CoA hydratase/isomerase family protein [Desulfarculus sp.]|nr:enoyl-CoA hydratase/isomerase family protein [Desulfarculus sp.]
MAYETILYAKDGAVATVTINRPKVLNALNPKVVAELGQAFAEVAADDEVKVAILTGAGGKAFVAGADIAAMSVMNPVEARNFSRQLQEVTSFMEALGKPIICAVDGFALGGGTEMALACDFIYASEASKFGQPEINLGVIPGAGGTQRLSRLVGKNWAKELCLTGDIIDVALAKEIGLVNRVFTSEELMPAALKTAKKIASKGRVSTKACKDLINFGFDVPLDHALRMEADAFGICFASPDQKEGMTAFLEKRKAEFKGSK